MTIERQRSRIYAVRWVSVSVVLKLRTEIELDWISVEKPGGVLEVLEAAGGKLRVAQGPPARPDHSPNTKSGRDQEVLPTAAGCGGGSGQRRRHIRIIKGQASFEKSGP